MDDRSDFAAHWGFAHHRAFPDGSVAGVIPTLFNFRLVIVRNGDRLGYEDGW